MLMIVLRGFALALASFTGLNLLAGQLRPGLDCNGWWISLPELPAAARDGLLLGVALALLLAASGAVTGLLGRRLLAGVIALAALACLRDACVVWSLAWSGEVGGWHLALPLSLLLALALGALARELACGPSPERLVGWPLQLERGLVAGCAAAWLLAWPLAQVACLGPTDYRRPADAIVVFGARVYADGTLSHAAADRVMTGASLYRQGLAPRLIVSGGPGDGAIHETEAMARLAERLGVPAHAIERDPDGHSTAMTCRNTAESLGRRGLGRVLAVSHSFHLPRIKMAYQRHGIEALTVPLERPRMLVQLPWQLARESAAWWVYYLRPMRAALAS